MTAQQHSISSTDLPMQVCTVTLETGQHFSHSALTLVFAYAPGSTLIANYNSSENIQ